MPATDKNKVSKKELFKKYDEAAEYNYYDQALRKALMEKNPKKFMEITKAIQSARSGGNVGAWSSQEPALQDYKQEYKETLNDDEIKAILSKLNPVEGQNPYERFQQLRRSKDIAGSDFGTAERYLFNDYSVRDLAADKVMSWVDGNYYYKPEVVNGKLVRKTNLGIEGAIRDYFAKQ